MEVMGTEATVLPLHSLFSTEFPSLLLLFFCNSGGNFILDFYFGGNSLDFINSDLLSCRLGLCNMTKISPPFPDCVNWVHVCNGNCSFLPSSWFFHICCAQKKSLLQHLSLEFCFEHVTVPLWFSSVAEIVTEWFPFKLTPFCVPLYLCSRLHSCPTEERKAKNTVVKTDLQQWNK